MKHTSIPLNTPCEMIEVTPVNPLISKCQIKVCYVGDQPNRNGSVITKDVAKELANSLPGSPIVGYYNESNEDFEEHNRELVIKDGEVQFLDTTKPYGFVDLGAKVWFQKFLDDNQSEHEYLMTEGYIWTGQYPEAQRIIEKGNNQSMELDENSINGHWAEIEKNGPEFFIINEAIISKLCILGEEFEPCFEGSTVSKVQFSLNEDFKESVYSMTKRMKEILNEGGFSMSDVNTSEIQEQEDVVVEDTVDNEPIVEEGATIEYNLDEIPEYVELKNQYSQLEEKYNEANVSITSLQSELDGLKEFKIKAERVEKQKLIDTFSTLSAEEKLEVVTKIDEYSLDEIESKLSVIFARKMQTAQSQTENKEPTTYSYDINSTDYTDSTPDWVKAVKEVQENM